MLHTNTFFEHSIKGTILEKPQILLSAAVSLSISASDDDGGGVDGVDAGDTSSVLPLLLATM